MDLVKDLCHRQAPPQGPLRKPRGAPRTSTAGSNKDRAIATRWRDSGRVIVRQTPENLGQATPPRLYRQDDLRAKTSRPLKPDTDGGVVPDGSHDSFDGRSKDRVTRNRDAGLEGLNDPDSRFAQGSVGGADSSHRGSLNRTPDDRYPQNQPIKGWTKARKERQTEAKKGSVRRSATRAGWRMTKSLSPKKNAVIGFVLVTPMSRSMFANLGRVKPHDHPEAPSAVTQTSAGYAAPVRPRGGWRASGWRRP